jgi:hypothetical protein
MYTVPRGRRVPAIHCLRTLEGDALATNQVQRAPSSTSYSGRSDRPLTIAM